MTDGLWSAVASPVEPSSEPAEWRCLAVTRDGKALPPTFRGLHDHPLPPGSRPEPTTDASGRYAFGRCVDHQAVTIWRKEEDRHA